MTRLNKLKHKKFIPCQIDESLNDFTTMLDQVDTGDILEGSVVQGIVVGTIPGKIIVDVGLKNEGRIDTSEFVNEILPKVGDIVEVCVEKREDRFGKTVLSRTKAIRRESWIQLEEAWAKGEQVEGEIFGRIKGGFTVSVRGVVAFLPGSQVDVRPIKDPNTLMGYKQPFKILKMDAKLDNIVISRRAILEELRSGARDEMLSKIQQGDVLEGIIKNITDYGAFVDLGDVDGLLHMTDISWKRINHPSEIISIGQKVKVVVVKYHEAARRVSLGMKQLEENPWPKLKEEFTTNITRTGKVTNITDYGVFIELVEGIEGLVHSSEISWVKSSQNPKKLLTIGQEVEFVVLDVDIEKHRISLSIKQCSDNPLLKFAKENPVGTILNVPIRNITDFGLFVALDANIDGLIHETDLSYGNNNSELLRAYNKNDIVQCKILSIDVEKERIALGIKQLSEQVTVSQNIETSNIHDEYKKNMIVIGYVYEVKPDAIEINVDDKLFGSIKKTELSLDKFEQNSSKFSIGDKVEAQILNIDKNGKANLSIKSVEIAHRDKAMKDYGTNDSINSNFGDIIGEALRNDANIEEKK
jgi:small subunit ribosomal protein S1